MTDGTLGWRPANGPSPAQVRGEEPDPVVEWLVAESAWWDGRLNGRSALRLVDGCAHGEPVPVSTVPLGAGRRKLPGTLLPGLRDAHVHSALVDLGTVRAGGIAEVWDLGGAPDRVADLRQQACRHPARLPRMRIAGPFLTAPGGYPADRPWAPPGSCREVRSPEDARSAVGECRAIGVDLIKVTAHAGGPTLPPGTLRALVEAAHQPPAGASTDARDRLDVVVHAEGPGTVAAAVEAGADLLAHTPWTERVDEGLLRSAAAAGMRWISTLDIHGWGSPGPEFGAAVDNLRRFLGYGGSVVYGTDLGNGPLIPGVNPREIGALQRAGLTPDEILGAMTTGAQGLAPSWIAGGIDLDATRFPAVMATARVIGPEVRPRGGS